MSFKNIEVRDNFRKTMSKYPAQYDTKAFLLMISGILDDYLAAKLKSDKRIEELLTDINNTIKSGLNDIKRNIDLGFTEISKTVEDK